MSREPITEAAEIEAHLARMRSCALSAPGGSGKAALTDMEEGRSLVLSTDGLRLAAGARVWLEFIHHGRRFGFEARVLEVSPAGARLSYPTTLYEINLRSFFRVEAAAGSRVGFTFQGRQVEGELVDLSAGGAAFVAEPCGATKGTRLQDLELSLPVEEEGEPERVLVPAAAVRRIEPAGAGRMRYGVSFEQLGKEAQRLMFLVRRRELQLARLTAMRE